MFKNIHFLTSVFLIMYAYGKPTLAIERTPPDRPVCNNLFETKTDIDFSPIELLQIHLPLNQENYKYWYETKWFRYAPEEILTYVQRKIQYGSKLHAKTVVSLYLQNKIVSQVISLEEFLKLAELSPYSPFSSPWDLRPILSKIFSMKGVQKLDSEKIISKAYQLHGLSRNKVLIQYLTENFHYLDNPSDLEDY